MFNFDEVKMCFMWLSDADKLALKHELINLIVNGIPCKGSRFFKAWCKQFGFTDDRTQLLVMTTAYPQRALLSFFPSWD